MTRITEEDIIFSSIVVVVSLKDARHPLPLGFINTVNKYIFVQLFKIGHRDTLKTFNINIRRIDKVPIKLYYKLQKIKALCLLIDICILAGGCASKLFSEGQSVVQCYNPSVMFLYRIRSDS
jgi:hypothetical protein